MLRPLDEQNSNWILFKAFLLFLLLIIAIIMIIIIITIMIRLYEGNVVKWQESDCRGFILQRKVALEELFEGQRQENVRNAGSSFDLDLINKGR